MFWKTKKAYILVGRDGLTIAMDKLSYPIQFPFSETLVHNLELIDQIGFEKALLSFFEKNSMSSVSCTLILDERFLFWKKGSADGDEVSFFNLIPLPLDQQIHKKTRGDGTDYYLSAYNISILTSLQRALHVHNNRVLSILPFFAFPAFESGEVNIAQCDEKSIRKSCRFDSDIMLFHPHKTFALPILVGITLFLLLLSGGSALFYMNYAKKQTVQPVPKQVKKVVVPTPTITLLHPQDIRIEVLNGSSRYGEAGRLKATLEKAEYTISSIGTSQEDIALTEIAQKITVPKDVLSKLTLLLEKQYKMSSSSATIPLTATSSADIVITIGKEQVE